MIPRDPNARTHLLTVVLEDYFQVAPLENVVQTGQWYRFEKHVADNTRKALDLLDEYHARATFFVLGWIADEMPEVVREVAARGHEVASKGYYHRSLSQMSPEEFRDDVVRSREAIERACDRRVHGYRIAQGWFQPNDLWALDVLARAGYTYDSSLRPIYWRFARQPWRRVVHRHRCDEGELWEVPLSTWSIAGWSLPIAGGNYMRQFPHALVRRAVAAWDRKHDAPFVMYFHVWELDPDQPRINAAPLLERVRQYRNLDRMEGVIRHYLERYRFTAIAEHLGLASETATATDAPTGTRHDSATNAPAVAEDVARPGTPVTIVVPCFDEEMILPYLANTLASVEAALSPTYVPEFIFVDDGSTDGTWGTLQQIFGGRTNCVLLRHDRNRGVAAAILTGLRNAGTEIVCSVDCDCTYDPHQLRLLIPLLDEGVDLVTASPYHPDGQVRNVPSWRLFLSRRLSGLYRLVLRQKLATYTSCFRVYRRQAVADLKLRDEGFLGVAEILGLVDLRGGRVVECPAVLEVRLLGRSKMKILKTILGHLKLLVRLGALRVSRRKPPESSGAAAGSPSAVPVAGKNSDPRRKVT